MHLCLVCQTNNDNNPIIIVEERGCCHYLIGNHRSMIIEIRIYILLYERGIFFLIRNLMKKGDTIILALPLYHLKASIV